MTNNKKEVSFESLGISIETIRKSHTLRTHPKYVGLSPYALRLLKRGDRNRVVETLVDRLN